MCKKEYTWITLLARPGYSSSTSRALSTVVRPRMVIGRRRLSARRERVPRGYSRQWIWATLGWTFRVSTLPATMGFLTYTTMSRSAPSSTPTLPQQTQTSYYTFPHNGNYYLAGTPGTYSGMQYTTHTWPGNTAGSHIPLSSYSSLNGATTSTSASFHSSQLPSSSSPPPSQIMIEYVVCCHPVRYLICNLPIVLH